MSSTPDTAAEPLALRKNRPYTLLMAGRTTQLVGSGIGSFAVPLIAYALTGSVAQAGTIAAIGQIGGLIMTLPTGVLADRADRRKIILGAAAIGTLVWGWIAAAGVLGWLTGWQLAVALFVSSVIGTAVSSAEAAAIRYVVPVSQLPQAMSVVEGRGAVASLLGGPVGGLLYSLGRMVPIISQAVGELAVLISTFFIRVPLNDDRDGEPEHPLKSLAEGLRFCWGVPLFRACIGLFAMVNLTVNALVIAITLHLVQLHTTPFLIGLLDFVAGASTLIGSLFAGRLLNHVRVVVITISALVLLSIGMVIMAVVQQYPVFLIMLGVPMLLAPALNAGLGGYVAAITPHNLQGRLSSVLSLCFLLSAPLSPVVGSQLLAHFGLGVTLWVLAIALAVTTLLITFVRSLRRIGLPQTWADDLISWPHGPTTQP
ncbi:MAG: MFS transporter [Microlunatus sp.]|nr:MFS transporter [Microlunatus sp.]